MAEDDLLTPERLGKLIHRLEETRCRSTRAGLAALGSGLIPADILFALEDYRQASGLSEEEFNARAGLSKGYYTKLFDHHDPNPYVATIAALYRALDLHADSPPPEERVDELVPVLREVKELRGRVSELERTVKELEEKLASASTAQTRSTTTFITTPPTISQDVATEATEGCLQILEVLSKRFAKIDQMRAGPAARLALRGLSYQAEYAKAWITTVHESGAQPDGDDNRDDGPCTPLCAPPTCGDGLLQEPELCDDGEANKAVADGLGGCSENCVPLPVCGDGIVHPAFEECDDGNLSDSDDCTNACLLPTCGDGVQQPGEECDDGNDINTDNCTNACAYPRCGDGIVTEGLEDCEDGNDDNHDACLNVCVEASCGDGVLWEGVEECDDGNLNDDDGCNAECFRDRLVFVTDEPYGVSQISALNLAYLRCSQQADKAGLPNPTSFRAWISDGVESPSTRFDHAGGRYVLSTGEVIAYGWDDLTDGELLHPINRTVDGKLLEVAAWTATKPDGTAFSDGHCEGWSVMGATHARYGVSSYADAQWTNHLSPFPAECADALHLYCFEARI